MREVLVLAALGVVLAGWGSCGGNRYHCDFLCAENETYGVLNDVSAGNVEEAENACESTSRGACQHFSCSCADNSAQ